ncbi:glycosyltransferase family 4 protein [Flavobacterium phycosphaerae]|uniref:glycosyltransferase family 4 protein n=1 Tax=Flavobacterium phycosphaerae TaxID=2697515 RepID=UPI00138A4A93|nr:glycosyltransferase family 4 protein [Flavobacterium phycosphaerae]
MEKQKLVRITTVPISLDKLLTGQLGFMSSRYEVIAVSAQKDALEKIGEKENIRTFHVEMSRKITPIHDLLATFRLFLFLRKEKPIIVHSHTPKAGIVGMLAAWLARVPIRLHTVAGLQLLESQGFTRKLLDFVEKMTYAFATNVYPNSKGLEAIIIANNYCKPQKLKVIANGSSNGIDTQFFNPEIYSAAQKAALKQELQIHETDFVFVFVGRLVKDKGINEMIAAFDELQKDHPQTKLLLVGDYEADLDPLLPETIAAINENKAIVSVGFQYDVRPYFAISDGLVFPSYREGFPNVVMQAGAMGLPSIVTDINGCNEIIEPGKNGIIIPVKDKKAIFDAMLSLLSDAELRNTCCANARNLITSRFQQDKIWQALEKEYKQLEEKYK